MKRYQVRSVYAIAYMLCLAITLFGLTGTTRAIAQTAKVSRSFQGEIPAGGAVKIVVQGHNGNIDARATDATRVTYRATLKTDSLSEASRDSVWLVRRGNTIYINERCVKRTVLFWEWPNCDIDYVISYPRTLRAQFVLVNGNVTATGTGGEIEAKTGNGYVTVTDARGNVSAAAQNGKITVAVAPSWKDGWIKARTHAGSIEIRVPRSLGATVAVREPWGSHAGGNAYLPPGPARIDATTVFGRVRIDRLSP